MSFQDRGEGSKRRPACTSALINCYKLLELHRALCWDLATIGSALRSLEKSACCTWGGGVAHAAPSQNRNSLNCDGTARAWVRKKGVALPQLAYSGHLSHHDRKETQQSSRVTFMDVKHEGMEVWAWKAFLQTLQALAFYRQSNWGGGYVML